MNAELLLRRASKDSTLRDIDAADGDIRTWFSIARQMTLAELDVVHRDDRVPCMRDYLWAPEPSTLVMNSGYIVSAPPITASCERL